VRALDLGAPSHEWRSRERITVIHLRGTGGSNCRVGEVPKRSKIQVSCTQKFTRSGPKSWVLQVTMSRIHEEKR
jgi:hypothetical protein